MKLDRNINTNHKGKYALIKLRNVDLPLAPVVEIKPEDPLAPIERPLVSVPMDAIDFGDTHDSDFFVIRLKDKYAAAALTAYAQAAFDDDPEYASEVLFMAASALLRSNKRKPD